MMKRTFTAFALMLSLGGAVAMAQEAAKPAADATATADNLIVNPSFETPAGHQPNQPQGWHVRAKAPEYVTGAEGAETHTGTRAVRLSSPPDFHQRWAVNNDKMPKVAGGDTARFSAWVNVTGLSGREFVQLRLEQFSADGKMMTGGEGSAYVLGQKHRPAPGQWVQVSDELKLHADARSIRPLLVFASGNPDSTAIATFDDVELVIVQP